MRPGAKRPVTRESTDELQSLLGRTICLQALVCS